MPTVKVRNIKNEEVGEVELSEAVFGAPLNEALIHAAVQKFHGKRAAGNVGHKDAWRCLGRGPQVLEAKRHGPRAYRVAAFATVERRRQRPWSTAPRLVLQHAEEDAPGRIAFSACPSGCAKETFSWLTSGRWTSRRRRSLLRRLGRSAWKARR